MSTAILDRASAEARSKLIKDIDYDLELDLTGRETYRGKLTVRFAADPQGRDLFLDFSGRRLVEATLNGRPLDPASHAGFRIPLPGALLTRGENTAVLAYENHYDNDGAGLHRVVDHADGREYVFTHFEPYDANRLLPCFDQPDLRASFQLTVATPKDWVVVASGPELSARDEGDRRVRVFARNEKFSTYILALAAGPFAYRVDLLARIPSRILTTQSLAPFMDWVEIAQVTRQGFDFFEKYFESPYPFKKYDQVFVPQFNIGAMENVACVILNGDRMVHRHKAKESEREKRADTVVHEMAHMWFGDLVTVAWWNDTWLKEAFATYMASLCLSEATRFKDAWVSFYQRSKTWGAWQDELPTTHPIETEVPDTDTGAANFDGITYGKGAAVLKQLSYYLGPEVFRKGVVEFLRQHRFGAAKRQDFIACLARVAGVGLDEWVRAWLQSPGMGAIRPRLEVEGGVVKKAELEQEPVNGELRLRPHRLAVAAWYDEAPSGMLGTPTVGQVVLDGPSARMAFLEGKPAPRYLSANYGDQAYGRIRPDPASLAFAREHYEKLPPGLERAGAWQAFWLAVRDKSMKPGALVDLVAAKGTLETDPEVLGHLGENLETLLDQYLAPSEGAARRAALAELAWERARAVAPGSDLQREWVELMVACCGAPQALDRLAALLDGRSPLAGLELDPELRWTMLRQLSAHGHPEAEERVRVEGERDPGERGRRAAFRAWVSRPDPAVKAQAFERFLEDRETELDFIREGMRGFWWAHQEAVLAPFRARYFEMLPRIAKERERPWAKAFTQELYPVRPPVAAVVPLARARLEAAGELLPSMRRALIEKTWELELALAVQAG